MWIWEFDSPTLLRIFTSVPNQLQIGDFFALVQQDILRVAGLWPRSSTGDINRDKKVHDGI